jgi:hypothetical protein
MTFGPLINGWQQRQSVGCYYTTGGKFAPFQSELAETQTTHGGFADVRVSNLKLSLFCQK